MLCAGPASEISWKCRLRSTHGLFCFAGILLSGLLSYLVSLTIYMNIASTIFNSKTVFVLYTLSVHPYLQKLNDNKQENHQVVLFCFSKFQSPIISTFWNQSLFLLFTLDFHYIHPICIPRNDVFLIYSVFTLNVCMHTHESSIFVLPYVDPRHNNQFLNIVIKDIYPLTSLESQACFSSLQICCISKQYLEPRCACHGVHVEQKEQLEGV